MDADGNHHSAKQKHRRRNRSSRIKPPLGRFFNTKSGPSQNVCPPSNLEHAMVVLLMNRHHLYWPKSAYRRSLPDPLATQFRELGCNQELMLVDDHRRLHDHSCPPVRPSRRRMRKALRRHYKGLCSCTVGAVTGGFWTTPKDWRDSNLYLPDHRKGASHLSLAVPVQPNDERITTRGMRIDVSGQTRARQRGSPVETKGPPLAREEQS